MLFRKVLRTSGQREQRIMRTLHHRGSRQGWLTMGGGEDWGGGLGISPHSQAGRKPSLPFPSLPFQGSSAAI